MPSSKTPRVTFEQRSYRPDAPASLVYRPHETASRTDLLFLIASGFGGVQEDYRRLAREIAALGGTAVVPNCNEPSPEATSTDPLEYRSDTLSFTAEQMLAHYELSRLVLVGHSFGDACQAHVVDKAPGELAGYISLMGQGYEDITLFNRLAGLPSQIGRAAVMWPKLVAKITAKPHANIPRVDWRKRLRELEAIFSMEEGHNLPYVERAKKAGAACVAIVGPKDKVISAAATRRIAGDTYGAANIVDAHALADHFAPQTHPRHIARLVFYAVSGAQKEHDLAA